MINISDDDDLQAAFDVANRELQGNLKISVAFKEQSLKKSFPLEKAEETKGKMKEGKTGDKKEKKEKRKRK